MSWSYKWTMVLPLGMSSICSNHSGWSVVRRTRDCGDNGMSCSCIRTGCERPRLRIPCPLLVVRLLAPLATFSFGFPKLALTRNMPGMPTSLDLVSKLGYPLVSKTGTDAFTVFPALAFGLLKIVTVTHARKQNKYIANVLIHFAPSRDSFIYTTWPCRGCWRFRWRRFRIFNILYCVAVVVATAGSEFVL